METFVETSHFQKNIEKTYAALKEEIIEESTVKVADFIHQYAESTEKTHCMITLIYD